MGIYINPTTDKGPFDKEKAIAAVSERIDAERFRNHVPGADGMYAVCIVRNPMFSAALVAYSRDEARYVGDHPDPRPKCFYLIGIDAIRGLDPIAADTLQGLGER
jgi:hypothetical protein